MKLLKLVPEDTNIKFLKWRLPFYLVSLLLIAASWALVMTNGLNYGVDFAGGQEIRATFTQSAEAPVAELREQVGALEPVIFLLRHAVAAAEIAAVGDRNAQLAERAAQNVTQRMRMSGSGHVRRLATRRW